MDKWQKRAAERRKQREKQLRQRMMIAGGAVVALLVVIFIITRVAGGSKVEKKGSSSEAASSSVSSENAAVSGTNGVVGDTAGITADTSATDSVLVATVTGEIAPDEATVTPNPDDPRAIFAVDPNRTDWNFDKDGDKVVYLTLDDGPSYLTMQFLDMLDACDVKATFFVTSQDPSYADCIQEAYRRGHTIGLHTSSHSFEIYKSVEDYFWDLEQIGNVVRDQIGYVPAFIRFPGGSFNTRSARYAKGIMAKLTEEVQKRGYQYWDWNAETGDGNMLSVEEEIAEATSCDYNNIVMLAHDGDLKEATLEALPTIIQNYKDRGYTFKPLDREAKVIHHEVLN